MPTACSHRVLEYFPNRDFADVDDSKKAITVQHLLNITSGLAWDEGLAAGRRSRLLAAEMRSRADIETASRRSVSQKQRSTDESGRGSAPRAEFERHAVRNRARGAVAC
jgi:CubicO group peptidase (beta-lactamase class C family)